MKKKYLVETPENYEEVIKDILGWAEQAKKTNLVLALSGDLGAGKTTFTQTLAKYFSVTEPVTSPTFTIMKKYDLNNDVFRELIHIDTYRLENEAEVVPLHLKSLFERPDTIICLEWPEKIAKIIPADAIEISLLIGEGENREVLVAYP